LVPDTLTAEDASATKVAYDHGDSSTRRGSKAQFVIDESTVLMFENCVTIIQFNSIQFPAAVSWFVVY
jgi:hypothetical protein